MPVCKNCGGENPAENAFCAHCGAKLEEAAQTTGTQSKAEKTIEDLTNKFNDFNNTKDTTDSFDKKDIDANKGLSVLAYFSWLVLIPLFAAKDSKFARFHSNQGLILAIIGTLYGVLSSAVSAIFTAIFIPLGAIVSALFSVVGIVIFVFAIIGIVNAANGKAKELPIIGKYKLLK